MEDFLQFNAEVLKEKPKNFKMELSGIDDSDCMFIKAVAITEGVNANNALFERADLHRARRTLVGKPLRIRFVNGNPTGHGFDPKTGTFDELVKDIGYIYDVDAFYTDENGEERYAWEETTEGTNYRLVVYMVVWQNYYPEIALRLRQLHASGDLAFSIEATRDAEITAEGYRRCFNIQFNGLAVVQNPAFENARSIIVAELLNKGGSTMDFEKLYNEEKARTGDLAGKLALAEKDKEIAETELKKVSGELAEKSEKLIEKEGELKTVVAERDSLKSEKEVAEKQKVGAERHSKLSKYGEVAKSVEELAELSDKEYLSIFEEAVTNYQPNTENAEDNSVTGVMGVPFTNSSKEVSNKEKLMQIVRGLSI